MNTKLLITGDYCPVGRNKFSIEKQDYLSIFGNFLSITSTADFLVTNLECPITNHNIKIKKTGPNLRFTEEGLFPLTKAGFNLVTLANNHIMDYGSEGLKSTLKACKKHGINTVGVGSNLEEARKPYYHKIKGKIFAFVNIAENEFCTATETTYGANPLNVITNHYDIKNAKKEADFVIVISHGGREHYQLPTPKMKERFRFFVDSGADVVIGHHTHCFSGYEIYNEKKIFYGLGNFIFDYKKKYQKGPWTQGIGLMLEFEHDKIDFKLIPFNQGTEKKVEIELLIGNQKKVFDEQIKKINKTITNRALFMKAWENYIKTQKKDYLGHMLIQNNYLRAIIRKGYLPAIYFHSKKHKRLLLNLLKCETHHEIMTSVLNEKLY